MLTWGKFLFPWLQWAPGLGGGLGMWPVLVPCCGWGGGRGGHPLWERKGMVALLSSIPKRQQVMVLQMRNPKQSDA